MKEAKLRGAHAKLGLILAVLLSLQAASGMLLAVGALVGSDGDAPKQSVVAPDQGAAGAGQGAVQAKAPEKDAPSGFEKIVKAVHLGGGDAGKVYRIVLILAYFAQMGMGVAIYARVRARKAGR